ALSPLPNSRLDYARFFAVAALANWSSPSMLLEALLCASRRRRPYVLPARKQRCIIGEITDRIQLVHAVHGIHGVQESVCECALADVVDSPNDLAMEKHARAGNRDLRAG